eukprot:6684491-Ditylum_brightwellii.AAC.1
MPPEDTSPRLNAKQIKQIRQIVGALLYYARGVDSTITKALNSIRQQQNTATEQTEKYAHQLLYYMATHPDAAFCYFASDMVLNIHTDASYLMEPKAQSTASGHYFLGSIPQD